MTLEELELRARSAYPEATIFRELRITLTVRLDEPHQMFAATPIWDDLLMITPDRRSTLDARELEHRIRGVTAHDMIAARRRLALEELARLDADLIMNEPPVEPQA